MEENLKALDELNKGADMGMVAIDYLYNKVKSKDFKKVLKSQYKDYKRIVKEAKKLYSRQSDEKPQEVNTMAKVMSWYGIEMKYLMDKTDSKIAELLMNGTNMGIVEGRKMLNNKNVDKKINKLLDEFVNMQEKYIEVLKTYL